MRCVLLAALEEMIAEPMMLSKEYLETARTLFRVARSMADQAISDRLRALAEDYERRAERASQAQAANASASRPVRPEFAEK